MKELIRNLEKFIAETEKNMEQAVAEMLDQPLPELTEEKFALFETTGNRLIYEREYFGKRRFLTLYGVAALRMKQDGLEKLGDVSREDICKKLEAVLWDICNEECWALPAHVNRKENPDWRNTVALFASETAEALAYVTDFLSDWLSQECCETVRENVKRRVLDPFFSNPVGRWHWEQCDHNWNAVCNGNIGAAYLHSLREEEEGNGEYIERICNNLGYFIDGYAEDGTCMEGLGYFDYGMTYFTNLAMELYDASEGSVDLLRGDWDKYKAGENDKRAKIAAWWSKCFFKSGRTISFSDGSSRGKFRMGLGCALAMRFPEVKLPDFGMAGTFHEDHCARFTPYKLDYFCTRRYLEMLKEQEAAGQSVDILTEDITVDQKAQKAETVNPGSAGEFIILDAAQWCIGKAANGVGMACKGGHNDEPHNHNDVGSFLYVVGDDMLLTDLGAGEYTKEYFSDGRYNIFCNNSFSHNVPIIAGQGQKNGKTYKATHFAAIDNESCGVAEIQAAAAYEEGLIKGFDRQINFEKQTGKMIVTDTFDNQNGEILITENLVSQFVPQITDGVIVLKGNCGCCQVEVKVAEAVQEDTKMPEAERTVSAFDVKTQYHSGHGGKKDPVYQIQWDVPVKNKTIVVITVTPLV